MTRFSYLTEIFLEFFYAKRCEKVHVLQETTIFSAVFCPLMTDFYGAYFEIGHQEHENLKFEN